jgi:hypothetical protein
MILCYNNKNPSWEGKYGISVSVGKDPLSAVG